MSRGTRIAFLVIAVVIAIVAIVVLADSSEDDGGTQTSATATPTGTPTPAETAPGEEMPTATPTPEPTPPPPPLLTADKVTELQATEGKTVRFRARSATDDEVHVHGYDLSEDAPAGQTITMSFKATITGIFEIEFENAGKEIGKLTVEPG